MFGKQRFSNSAHTQLSRHEKENWNLESNLSFLEKAIKLIS